jgi:hypothetical protein
MPNIKESFFSSKFVKIVFFSFSNIFYNRVPKVLNHFLVSLGKWGPLNEQLLISPQILFFFLFETYFSFSFWDLPTNWPCRKLDWFYCHRNEMTWDDKALKIVKSNKKNNWICSDIFLIEVTSPLNLRNPCIKLRWMDVFPR